jgi:hypothetical protein
MKRLLVTGSVVVAAGILYSSVALAETPEWRAWPLGQRLSLGVSAFRPKIDTKISLTGSENVIEGSIDFERDLGLKDTKSTPVGELKWRISKRNKFRFDYFDLSRSGQGNSKVLITINSPDGGPSVAIPIDTSVQSYVDIKVYNFGYEFSPVFNEKMDWSLGLGISWQDIALGIKDLESDDVEGDTKVAAPLPTLSTSFSYAINDKWLIDLGLGWLDLDLDLDNSGKFEGKIIRFNAGVRWQTWENVGFMLAYRSFDVDVNARDSDFNGKLDYSYKGPSFGINAYF